MSDLENIDATSKYQNSLPISSNEFMAQLNLWRIQFERFDHVPLKTVEEAKKVQAPFLLSDQGGGHIKNLYLRGHKKRNIL